MSETPKKSELLQHLANFATVIDFGAKAAAAVGAVVLILIGSTGGTSNAKSPVEDRELRKRCELLVLQQLPPVTDHEGEYHEQVSRCIERSGG